MAACLKAKTKREILSRLRTVRACFLQRVRRSSSSLYSCVRVKRVVSGERLLVPFEIAFPFPLRPAGFSMFNPLPKLSLPYPPLTAYLEGRQLVNFDHSVKRALGNLE